VWESRWMDPTRPGGRPAPVVAASGGSGDVRGAADASMLSSPRWGLTCRVLPKARPLVTGLTKCLDGMCGHNRAFRAIPSGSGVRTVALVVEGVIEHQGCQASHRSVVCLVCPVGSFANMGGSCDPSRLFAREPLARWFLCQHGWVM